MQGVSWAGEVGRAVEAAEEGVVDWAYTTLVNAENVAKEMKSLENIF